jgi:hypothetical protein
MPDKSTLPFYEAYVINVRDLSKAETEIKRAINRAIKSGRENAIVVQTKVYALIYSTFSEASFMKMILTPYGFEQEYVNEILKQETIQQKWQKCLEIGFLKFTKAQKGSDVPNKVLELSRIIQKYIVDPSVLRNKIAHGQLTIALNRSNTNLNTELTSKLRDLDFVTIYVWFEINRRLCSIIEDLIESPDKAHYRYYFPKYQELEEFIAKTSKWTPETKRKTRAMSRKIPSKE